MPSVPNSLHLPLSSDDLTANLIDSLREAAPQIFSEGRIDFTKLQAALGQHTDDSPERYGLNWAGKREAFRNVQTLSRGTLRPQRAESVNWDTTENLIIEGDNLEVLKLLQKSYHARIKLIYIDPPYNTGNEFIYPDNFREGLDDYLRYTNQLTDENTAASTNRDTNGRYHSNWLNMMYPRLFLARNLLKEDGLIFVSIDDKEVHNLRQLMDEVFGEENFIGQIVWKSRVSEDTRAKSGLSTDHEYIIGYARSEGAMLRGVDKDLTKFDNPDNDPRGPWRSADLTGLALREQRPNLHYDIIDPATNNIFLSPPKGWRYEPSQMQRKIEEGRIIFPVSPKGRPRHKLFLEDMRSAYKSLSSVITSSSTSEGTKELKELIGLGVFSFPKPTSLLKLLIQQTTSASEDDIILDLFAGSGTTGDAVLQANQKDAGNRKFILVQLPEKTENKEHPTIAHITRKRIVSAIKKLQKTNSTKLNLNKQQSADLGFRAFTLDASNFKVWQTEEASAAELTQQLSLYADHILSSRKDDDILYELILKAGLPLSSPIKEFQAAGLPAVSIAEGSVVICLATHLTRETLRELFTPIDQPIPRLVLCLDASFDGKDALKTNAVLEAQAAGITFKTV